MDIDWCLTDSRRFYDVFFCFFFVVVVFVFFFFFFQAEGGIRDAQESRGLGDVYKGQRLGCEFGPSICRPQTRDTWEPILPLLALFCVYVFRMLDRGCGLWGWPCPC